MDEIAYPDARLLIVDDQPANVTLLQRLLEQTGYRQIVGLTDARQALPRVAEYHPDLILLDLLMPHLDGYALLQQLRHDHPECREVPVIVLTADIAPTARRRALMLGAKDFLPKPFDADEVLLRIRNHLATRMLYRTLQEQNLHLEERVVERTQELEAAQVETLERLALAAEYRDDHTGRHIERVGELVAKLAQQLDLPGDKCDLLRRAAPLHDVGKIGIPDQILLKAGKLTPEEFAVIKTHPTIGAGILGGSRHAMMQMAEEIALSHHERWDGTGYPRRLQGADIPIMGRIVAVADVFDALTHERPYKPAWSRAAAVKEIVGQRGRQFDPTVVDALLAVLHQDQPLRAEAVAVTD